MRNTLALLTFVVVAASVPAAAQIKDGDRQRLIAHLEMTESWLVSEVQGLSHAQLTYKMTPESWSIMDVAEHLAVAEPQYWEQLQKSMKQPPVEQKPEATDAAILWYGIDRSNRARTGEARVPTGRWKDIQGALGEFRKLR